MSSLKGNAKFDSVFSSNDYQIQDGPFKIFLKKNEIDYLIGENGKLIELVDKNLDLPFIFGNVDIENFLHFKNIIDYSKFHFENIQKLYYFRQLFHMNFLIS